MWALFLEIPVGKSDDVVALLVLMLIVDARLCIPQLLALFQQLVSQGEGERTVCFLEVGF